MSTTKASEKQNFYPINIDLSGQRVLIVGGGRQTLAESKKLLEFGARIDILAPRPIIEVKQLEVTFKHKLTLLKESYDRLVSGDLPLEQYLLVFAYSSNQSINEKLASLCKAKAVLCTTLLSNGDFVIPSLFRRGHLKVAISSDGISNSLESVLLAKVEADSRKHFDDYALYLEFVKELIDKLPSPLNSIQKTRMYEQVRKVSLDEDVEAALRRNNYEEARSLFSSKLNASMEELNLTDESESKEFV